MKTTTLTVTCRDPIVSRDGRPFGSVEAARGSRMRIVGWPLPSVVAGSLRAALAKAAGREFTEDTIKELFRVNVVGFFPTCGEMLYMPAPQRLCDSSRTGAASSEPAANRRGWL